MLINWRLVLLPPLLLLCVSAVSPQQNHSAAHPGDRIYLDVIVSPKSGSPVSGLQEQDFTILDNNLPQTIHETYSKRAPQKPNPETCGTRIRQVCKPAAPGA